MRFIIYVDTRRGLSRLQRDRGTSGCWMNRAVKPFEAVPGVYRDTLGTL